MKIKQMRKFFRKANELLFEGQLPEPKIVMSHAQKELYGHCKVFYSKDKSYEPNFKIIIYRPNCRTDEDQKNTMIHEMVHLFIATELGVDIADFDNVFLDHDMETFCLFGLAAVDFGLIENPNLF